jgi:hypothetical protein
MPEQFAHVKGFLFPLPHSLIEQLFSGEKDVFVKLAHYRFLKTGNTLVFYDSGTHAIVGEAKVKQIALGDPSAIWEEFGARIFLQSGEFKDYVARSPLGPRKHVRLMSAFVLEKLRKYSIPKRPQKRVTPSGYYLPI